MQEWQQPSPEHAPHTHPSTTNMAQMAIPHMHTALTRATFAADLHSRRAARDLACLIGSLLGPNRVALQGPAQLPASGCLPQGHPELTSVEHTAHSMHRQHH